MCLALCHEKINEFIFRFSMDYFFIADDVMI